MKQRTLSFGARTIRVSLLSAWSLKESEYLRNIRVLKSKSLVRRKTKGISVAGYEIVRVLGKGSFGVVRLVREKGLPPPERPSTEQTESDIERLDGSDDERGRHDPSKIGKQVFAMKVIRKSDMLRNCQEGHLRAERDFLVASENSRWVVPLVASFQDNTNLYLVMEYMLGGDFLGLLMREDILDETTARWYVAEMILCIEEAHKMKWIHRDIKPDNFLITSSGHLKISDFGLAFDGHWAHNQTYFNEKRYNLLKKFGIDVRGDEQDAVDEVNAETKNQVFGNVVNAAFGRSQRKPSAFSLRDQSTKEPPGREENPILWMNRHQKRRLAKSIVGTSQYMAPEVIRGEEYDGRCDWWSIGIILYECLYGQTPFYCQDRKDTKQKIVHHHHFLSFPPEQRWGGPPTERFPLAAVSYAAMSLIKSLLTDKEIRLSSPQYRENDVCHDFPPRYHLRNHHRSFSLRSPVAASLQHASTAPLPGALSGTHRHVSASATGMPQQNHQRSFVFPDDAREIKEHPFFRGIDWGRLHLIRPPFVPQIRAGQDLTKYFDDETQILSSGDNADDPDADSLSTSAADANSNRAADRGSANAAVNESELLVGAAGACAEREKTKGRAKNRKEKRRPRDKLLRDPLLKRQVMEARKKGAFVGYTYRRPREIVGRKRCTVGEDMGAFAPPAWSC
ncbi:agc ndr protein kinase [Neofusicoccum parvum]|uniref:Agc ndr protein kinase n=1 Tax=Neofusicoccum parvum TaxID=310453 RepID=A0ACB5RV05_9PEZI|nr:agc ndr protein kinase [Neofusicoccum parvum]